MTHRPTVLLAALLVAAACDARPCEAPPVAPASPRLSPIAESVAPPPTEPIAPPIDMTRRSVLLVTIDTARADHFGVYGDARAHTPAFDALAAQGVRYAHAMTPTPLTVPAHTTLLTGVDPAVHGAELNGQPARLLPGSARPPLLAEAFGAAGYRTAAFVASIILWRRVGLATGFEVYDAPTPATRELAAADRVARALAWVDTVEGAPFFLWVHFMEPHAPHVAPPGTPAGVDAYDAEITEADAALGALLAGLDARGRSERLVVVVAGDHGEGLGEHGEVEHGVFLYEDTLHVPLVVRAAGEFEGGRVVSEPVTLADLSPTLRALCGLPATASDGVSLGEPLPVRDLAAQSLYPSIALGWAPLFALRRGSLVYIEAPRPELYDLTVDPRERRNVYRAERETARELAAALAARQAEYAARRCCAVQAAPLDAERAQLAALGYASQTSAPRAGGPDPKDRIADYEARRAEHGIVGIPDTVGQQ
jgi:arylsulfatase A-like enzyme